MSTFNQIFYLVSSQPRCQQWLLWMLLSVSLAQEDAVEDTPPEREDIQEDNDLQLPDEGVVQSREMPNLPRGIMGNYLSQAMESLRGSLTTDLSHLSRAVQKHMPKYKRPKQTIKRLRKQSKAKKSPIGNKATTEQVHLYTPSQYRQDSYYKPQSSKKNQKPNQSYSPETVSKPTPVYENQDGVYLPPGYLPRSVKKDKEVTQLYIKQQPTPGFEDTWPSYNNFLTTYNEPSTFVDKSSSPDTNSEKLLSEPPYYPPKPVFQEVYPTYEEVNLDEIENIERETLSSYQFVPSQQKPLVVLPFNVDRLSAAAAAASDVLNIVKQEPALQEKTFTVKEDKNKVDISKTELEDHQLGTIKFNEVNSKVFEHSMTNVHENDISKNTAFTAAGAPYKIDSGKIDIKTVFPRIEYQHFAIPSFSGWSQKLGNDRN